MGGWVLGMLLFGSWGNEVGWPFYQLSQEASRIPTLRLGVTLVALTQLCLVRGRVALC